MPMEHRCEHCGVSLGMNAHDSLCYECKKKKYGSFGYEVGEALGCLLIAGLVILVVGAVILLVYKLWW